MVVWRDGGGGGGGGGGGMVGPRALCWSYMGVLFLMCEVTL